MFRDRTRDSVRIVLWLAPGLCALFVTRIVYTVQKRFAYRDDQARTITFFPARPRREPTALE
ncbi:MAG: hypothetical protein NXI30_01920 [bacterium]|nr:hypothetical protein [bacterium]